MEIALSFFFKEVNQHRAPDFSVLFNDWYNLEISNVQKSNLSGESGHLR